MERDPPETPLPASAVLVRWSAGERKGSERDGRSGGRGRMGGESKKRGRHELVHLYLDRMEKAYRDYLAFFALTDADITARSQVFLWTAQADHEKVGQALCGYKTPDVEYKRCTAAI